MSDIESQWTIAGFMRRYEELVKESSTYMAAYLSAESEHKSRFGSNRYSSYDSFRMSRKEFISKK